MNDPQQTPPGSPSEPAPSTGAPAGEGAHPEADRGQAAREWLAQLQAMIENLATQAVPVAREIGAKAAELAAVAAEKAGPVAAKAAEVTADVGTRFAERSRSLATELRKDAEAEAPAAAAHGADSAASPASPTHPPDPVE
jgi:hypothetical protein